MIEIECECHLSILSVKALLPISVPKPIISTSGGPRYLQNAKV